MSRPQRIPCPDCDKGYAEESCGLCFKCCVRWCGGYWAEGWENDA